MPKSIKLLLILILIISLPGYFVWAQPPPANPVPSNLSPQWSPVKGVPEVEYAPNLKTDLFRYGQRYYYYHQGNWYRGRHTRGPWSPIRRLPPPLYRISAPYFKTPPGWAKGRKTGWGGAPMPPGQMKKYQGPRYPRTGPYRHPVPRPGGPRPGPPGQMKKHR